MADTDFTFNLVKGDVFDLAKAAPSVTSFYVGLGWEADFDLDVSAFPCTNVSGEPQLISPPYFLYYNNLNSPCGGLIHSPDALEGGADDGDDEWIAIQTSVIDQNIDEISIVVTINGAPPAHQNFSQVKNAYVRICELSGRDQPGKELARYNLTSDAGASTAVQFGSLTKANGTWNFEAVGEGFAADLGNVIQMYMRGAKIKR